MSLSAREKVLRVRWAQHQVTQLQKKLIRNFPQADEEESLGGRGTTDKGGRDGQSSGVDLHDPTERYSFNEYLARRNFLVSLPPNGPSRALSVPNSLIPTRSKSSRSFVGPISGEDYVTQPFPLPPTKLSNLKKKPKSLPQSSRRSPSKGSRSPTRRPVDSTGNSEVVAEPNEKMENIVPSTKSKKSPLMQTKNSVEALKTKSVQPYSSVPSSASAAKKGENTQGRMFRHRYSFQESVDPSPNVSRTSSAIPISKKLGAIGIPPGRKLPIPGIPRITSPTGSDILTPTRSADDLNNNADDEDLFESPSRQRQFVYGGPSRENLCIPSLLCTKKSIYERRLNGKTWVEKRFPKLADEVESWHKRFPFMKATTDMNGEYIGNGQNKHKKYKPTDSSIESVYNEGHHQPPPHKRGLVGVEISEFDADCAVFYHGVNGLYNPHLHVPPTAKDLRPNQGILSTRSARKLLWSPVSSKSLQRIRFSDEPHFNPKSKNANEM